MGNWVKGDSSINNTKRPQQIEVKGISNSAMLGDSDVLQGHCGLSQ